MSSLERAHQAVGSPITEALAKKLRDEAGHYVEAIVKEVSEYMIRRLPMHEPAKQIFDFEETKDDAKNRIDVELDLYFDSVRPANKRKTQAKGKKKKAESKKPERRLSPGRTQAMPVLSSKKAGLSSTTKVNRRI